MENEKRLIDANRLRFEANRYFREDSRIQEEVDNIICMMPTVDAVEVVRCKDCKYYEIHRPKVLENCERNGYLIPMKPYDFCSYGERRWGE